MNLFTKPQPARDPRFDPRWQAWAQGIREGATLAIRKWSGKNKMFTREEYEIGLGLLVLIGVLAKYDKQGYHPRRGEGWQYILDMAQGIAHLPPPPPGTTSPRLQYAVRRTGQRAHRKKRMEIAEEEGK